MFDQTIPAFIFGAFCILYAALICLVGHCCRETLAKKGLTCDSTGRERLLYLAMLTLEFVPSLAVCAAIFAGLFGSYFLIDTEELHGYFELGELTGEEFEAIKNFIDEDQGSKTPPMIAKFYGFFILGILVSVADFWRAADAPRKGTTK